MSIQQYDTSTVAVPEPRPAGALALTEDQTAWTDPQRAALAQLGIAEAPPADQQVFMHVAQRSGLDPFARQIYLIGRNDREAPGGKRWTIQTAIDGFRVIAERRPEYAGQTPPQWCDSDGTWTDVWLSKSPPSAARVGIHRHDREAITWGVVHFWEFAATKFNGELNKMWSEKPAHQIAKCAEAGALRRAFPQDFSGLYITEEMEAGQNGPRRPVRATAQRTSISAADLTGDSPSDEPAPEQVAMIDREQSKQIGDLFKAADVTDRAARARVVDGLVDRPITSAADLTHAEAAQLIADLTDMGPDGLAALADPAAEPPADDGGGEEVRGATERAEYASSEASDPADDPWGIN